MEAHVAVTSFQRRRKVKGPTREPLFGEFESQVRSLLFDYLHLEGHGSHCSVVTLRTAVP